MRKRQINPHISIDAWTHIFPPSYFRQIQKVASASGPLKRWLTLKSLYDLDERFRVMDQFENYAQVLTPSMPAFDEIADVEEAASLSTLMNDGLADLVREYPRRFPYFVAGISMGNETAAHQEIDRAISLGAIGFQLPSNVQGMALDHPRFQAIWDAIAATGRAVWLHPIRGPVPDYPTEAKSKFEIWWCFGWPYESSVAMARLVLSGLFDRHPHLRVLTHHMGGMIPFFAGRIEQGWGLEMGSRTPPSDADLLPRPLRKPVVEYFKNFYGDTSLSGSAGALRCGLDFFGTDQVVFATDFPFDAEGGSYLVRETLRSLDDLVLPDDDVLAIGQKNLAGLIVPNFTPRL
ncbi:amidohydrolase family protein [Rhizobium sullae]|uniref:Aminocarboxymuconate-semialdehyde decarboxylase n=1 Tax=Rhizobium sullae TaxID=50338 RepID=A0A4R3Q7J7_RHISU|nr:amidohydrolase family protein [Rhizobium sullae]TCU15282.1 aminocarboxymuconate-semialdehyde decarboxylase [Rhizobium sullae]